MGLSFGFHIEHLTDRGWVVPETFVSPYKYTHPGLFLYLSGKYRLAFNLFFGENAFFKIRKEIPPLWENSALYKWLLPSYHFEEDDYKISWFPYTELMVDLWNEPVIVTNEISAKFAHLFISGAEEFPEKELTDLNLSIYDIRDLRSGKISSERIDRSEGRGRYELEATPAENPLAISWIDTLSGYLGEELRSTFLDLRKYGDDKELRIITFYS